MNKNSIFLGIIGLLAGVAIGFFGANYLNEQSAPAASNSPFGSPNQPTGNTSNIPIQPGMVEDVQKTLDKAKENPKDITAQLEAGEMYFQIQKLDEALGFFQKAYDIDPKSVDTNRALAKTYFEKKQYPTAGKHFEAALEAKPNDPGLISDLGLSYYLREPKDAKKALEYYRKALEIEEKFEPAAQNLVVALKAEGDAEALKAAIEKLREINPNNPAIKAGP